MRYELSYGPTTLSLDLPERVHVADCRFPCGEPLSDISTRVASALSQPVNYPALSAATVPGDKVVVAVEPGLPQVENLVAGAIYSLVEGGTEPRNISVVVASNLRPPLALVPKIVRHDLRVVMHNPADQEGLQYLAADKAARPIYLNRQICEADLLLPVTTARMVRSLGYVGGYAGVFPTFADVETQRRFHAPSAVDHSVNQRRRRDEVDEAAWLLGVHFTMQIVPGAGDHILHIVAGEAQAVTRQAEQLSAHAWQHTIPQKVGMAIAAIDGGADQQTWENLARALDSAMHAVADGGVIALLTDLQVMPGRALATLAGANQDEELQQELEHQHSPDAHAAALLAAARERFDIYLLSGLQSDLIEGIGLGFVETPAQIAKLAAYQPSVALIGSAQFANCDVAIGVS